MPERSHVPGAPGLDTRGKRLDSWKEIAGYLNRHVTTVRRWERHEGPQTAEIGRGVLNPSESKG